MRLLFTSRPAYGHLYPMMPLALAAREAGHDVWFATGRRLVPMLQGLGFPTVTAGMSFEEALALDGAQPEKTDGRNLAPDLHIFLEVIAPATAAELAPQLEDVAPDLVIYEQGDLGAGVAAGAAGIPAAVHAISPWRVMAAVEPISREPLARLWAGHGIEPPPFDLFLGDAYIDIVPPALQHPPFLEHPARVAVRPVPWTQPGAALPRWVGSIDRPLVYLTLGTVVGTADALAPAVRALAHLDVDVLVALGSATDGTLGDLPANVHVEAFVDQAAVLPHADLVVHHGGSGTMLGALAHGRRQLLLPKGADQFFNADNLRRAGIAQALEPHAADEDAIAAAAQAALDAPVPQAALEVRDEIAAMPAPQEALQQLLDRVMSMRLGARARGAA